MKELLEASGRRLEGRESEPKNHLHEVVSFRQEQTWADPSETINEVDSSQRLALDASYLKEVPMKTYLITGANRGIGLALTKKLLEKGGSVIATARHPEKSPELQALLKPHDGRLQIHPLDITQEDSTASFLRSLNQSQIIDVLVNNSGILKEYNLDLEQISLNTLREHFEVNVIGTVRITQALLPFIQKSAHPLIATISSRVGSIDDNTSGRAYGYRMSKTALNMFNKSLSVDYPRIICVVLHPGWVKTEMGGKNAPVEPMESAEGLIKVMEGLSLQNTGQFIDYRGERIPW